MKCVIDCLCGGHHMSQCTCRRKMTKVEKKEGFVCKKIRVLPKCSQYYPNYAVRVLMNCELIKGKIVERGKND